MGECAGPTVEVPGKEDVFLVEVTADGTLVVQVLGHRSELEARVSTPPIRPRGGTGGTRSA